MKFFGEWKTYDDFKNDFLSGSYNYETKTYERHSPPEGFPTEREILIANYGTGSYEGYAFVIFHRKGKLFEYHDSHCSCNGLSWGAPTETTWKRLTQWTPSEYRADETAREALKALVAKNLKA